MAHLQYISWILMYNASGDKRNPHCIGSGDCIHDETGMWIYPSVSSFAKQRVCPLRNDSTKTDSPVPENEYCASDIFTKSLIVILKLCDPGFNLMHVFGKCAVSFFHFRSAQYEHTGFSSTTTIKRHTYSISDSTESESWTIVKKIILACLCWLKLINPTLN